MLTSQALIRGSDADIKISSDDVPQARISAKPLMVPAPPMRRTSALADTMAQNLTLVSQGLELGDRNVQKCEEYLPVFPHQGKVNLTSGQPCSSCPKPKFLLDLQSPIGGMWRATAHEEHLLLA